LSTGYGEIGKMMVVCEIEAVGWVLVFVSWMSVLKATAWCAELEKVVIVDF
jgi:hypothetical protein